jgi:hypothetical protein
MTSGAWGRGPLSDLLRWSAQSRSCRCAVQRLVLTTRRRVQRLVLMSQCWMQRLVLTSPHWVQRLVLL